MLSREPLLLGTLKAQDIIKGAVIVALIISIIGMLFGSDLLMKIFLQ